jgi:heptosyltransferase-2
MLSLDCQPCMKRVCPLGHHNCMNQLSVDAVFAVTVDLLRRRSAANHVTSPRVALVSGARSC